MKAMDAELARARSGQSATADNRPRQQSEPTPSDTGKGRAQTTDPVGIEGAMEAELQNMMERDDDDDDDDMSEQADYQLIKNFLESYKSQGGSSGPVGNLVGRLQGGWTLPRDDS